MHIEEEAANICDPTHVFDQLLLQARAIRPAQRSVRFVGDYQQLEEGSVGLCDHVQPYTSDSVVSARLHDRLHDRRRVARVEAGANRRQGTWCQDMTRHSHLQTKPHGSVGRCPALPDERQTWRPRPVYATRQYHCCGKRDMCSMSPSGCGPRVLAICVRLAYCVCLLQVHAHLSRRLVRSTPPLESPRAAVS